jgi:hypothetical protein
VTGYGLDDRGVGVRVPVWSRILSSPRRPDRLWGTGTTLPFYCFNKEANWRTGELKNDIRDSHSADGETTNAYRLLVGNLLDRNLRTHRIRWKDNILFKQHSRVGWYA